MGTDAPVAVTRPPTAVAVSPAVEPLEREWDELADRTACVPFFRPGWAAAWWNAFGAGELEILTARRDGRLAGVLPLYRQGAVLRAASNWHTPEFGILAEDSETARALADAPFASRPRRLAVAFLDAESGHLDEWHAAAGAAGYRVQTRTLERSPYLPVAGDWEAYEKRVNGNLRRDVRRRWRRLEEEGRVSLDVQDGHQRLEELLTEGFRLESSGWKDAEATAIRSHAHLQRFYGDVARWAAERGWLRLAFLRVGERPVAFEFGLEADGVYYFLKGGYEPAYHRFSPGKLLVYAMLRRAFSAGLERYEFLGGDDPWKLEWTELLRERVLVQAFAPSLAGVVESLAFAYGRPLAKRIPRLERTVVSRRK